MSVGIWRFKEKLVEIKTDINNSGGGMCRDSFSLKSPACIDF